MNQRIVCAAIRFTLTREVILGIRHFDTFMHKQLENTPSQGDPIEQGFIDQKGSYLTRTEAWKVAEAAGQIIRRVGGDTADDGTLFSENLSGF